MLLRNFTLLADRKRLVRCIVVAAAIAAVYLPTRLCLLLFYEPSGSDIYLYARYAYIHRLAAESRVSFHELYRAIGLNEVRDKGPLTPASFCLTVVAYPPLAVAFMNIPAFLARGGKSINSIPYHVFKARYQRAYRGLCMMVEMMSVLIVSLLICIVYKEERVTGTLVRMGVLCIAGLCMPDLLFNRLDAVLGALLAVSLAALLRRRRLLSFFLFALAVNFKVIPVFLLPVWVLGSFEASDFRQLDPGKRSARLLRMSVANGLIICGMIAGIFIFFYYTEGKGVMDFLAFHFDRGIHIESIWGTIVLCAARLFGMPFQIVYGYGAVNVVTPCTRFMPALSLLVLGALLLAMTIVLFNRCAEKLRRENEGESSCMGHRSVIEASLLYLFIVFSFSKIFSPQYLLVLVPLVAMAPLAGKSGLVFSFVFAALCFMSTLIFPCYYFTDVVEGPSSFGLFLLCIRTLLLLGMTGFLLARATFSRPGPSNLLL